MLQAITANLPVYQTPPRTSEHEQPSGTTDFGPAAEFDLESVRSRGSSTTNGSGLYGPDGQFVESNARRELQNQSRSSGFEQSTNPDEDTVQEVASEDTARGQRIAALKRESGQERNLSLAEADAAVPPAAREELRELVDRVYRRSQSGNLDVKEYRRLAQLMERIGRYEDAQVAETKAQELEHGSSEAAQATQSAVSADPASA